MKSSSPFIAMATALLLIIIAITSSVDAFSTTQQQRQLAHRQTNFLISERHHRHTNNNNRITTSKASCLYQNQQPNFGDWTNDDFLNSLGSGGGDNNQQQQQQQQNYNQNYNDYNENYNNEQFSTYDEAKAHLRQLNEQQQQQQPEMTDEEITEWAMRAAQFYNTESSVQEAYGMSAPNPPRVDEEGEGY